MVTKAKAVEVEATFKGVSRKGTYDRYDIKSGGYAGNLYVPKTDAPAEKLLVTIVPK